MVSVIRLGICSSILLLYTFVQMCRFWLMMILPMMKATAAMCERYANKDEGLSLTLCMIDVEYIQCTSDIHPTVFLDIFGPCGKSYVPP